MLMPAFKPTKVEAVFVVKAVMRSDHRTRTYQVISCQEIAHCYLSFTQDDEKYVVVINRKGGMYLVDDKRFQWLVKHADYDPDLITVDLGIAPVSMSLMSWFIDRPKFKMSSFWENIYWWCIGRHFSKTYVPMTCSLAISYILRMCGYKNDLHVAPHSLYKELENGVDNHFWHGEGGENCLGKSSG